MSRSYFIFGETMVYAGGSELGLCEGPVRIDPSFSYIPVHVDDFGPNVPAEKIWVLGEARITMELIHFDQDRLTDAIRLSMGGGAGDGVMAAAGTLMGGNLQQLKIVSIPSNIPPYIFTYCHLAEQPLEIPVGTSASKVRLTWASFPWVPGNAASSANTKLWNRA